MPVIIRNVKQNIIADVLTKLLAKDRHQALTKAMDLEAVDYSQSGSVEGRASGCMKLLEM